MQQQQYHFSLNRPRYVFDIICSTLNLDFNGRLTAPSLHTDCIAYLRRPSAVHFFGTMELSTQGCMMRVLFHTFFYYNAVYSATSFCCNQTIPLISISNQCVASTSPKPKLSCLCFVSQFCMLTFPSFYVSEISLQQTCQILLIIMRFNSSLILTPELCILITKISMNIRRKHRFSAQD